MRSRAYTYDDASRIATQTVESVTTTYGYDNVDQLTSESRSGYVTSYTYDGNGNRLTKTLNSVTDAYSYDDGDKLLAITRGGNEYKDYTYDACGRTATISDESTTQTFSYDYEDRVTQISGLATTNTFAYNGLDTRVKMVNSLGTSQFQRSGAGVTEPVVADGVATYTPGVSERRSGVTAYLHSGLKDADAQSGSSQTVVASRTYDAFGAVVSSSGTWKGPFGYAGSFGYQEDADTSYQLLGHRYYDPSTGRFLTRDPVKDGRNWYSYCENSPLDGVDPDGLITVSIGTGAQYISPGASAQVSASLVFNFDDLSFGIQIDHGVGHGIGALVSVGPMLQASDSGPTEGVITTLTGGLSGNVGVELDLSGAWTIGERGLSATPNWAVELGTPGVGNGGYLEVHVTTYTRLFGLCDLQLANPIESLTREMPSIADWQSFYCR